MNDYSSWQRIYEPSVRDAGRVGSDYAVQDAAGVALTVAEQRLFDAWERGRGDFLPGRKIFQTTLIHDLAEDLAFIGVSTVPDGSPSYKVRYVGGRLEDAHGVTVGADLAESGSDSWRARMFTLFRGAVERRRPQLGEAETGVTPKLQRSRVRHLVLPLSEDGETVTGIAVHMTSERHAMETDEVWLAPPDDLEVRCSVNPPSGLSVNQLQLKEAWDKGAVRGLPPRDCIKLSQFVDMSPWMLIFSVSNRSNGVYALSGNYVGAAVVEIYGEIIGTEFLANSAEQWKRRIYRACRIAMQERAPVLGVSSRIALPAYSHFGVEIYALPLGDNRNQVGSIAVLVEITQPKAGS